MLVSFVLRLRADRLFLGELVGEIEDVETGSRQPLRDVSELTEFCRSSALLNPTTSPPMTP